MTRLLVAFLLCLSWTTQALGRAVFAHFMVGNTEHYSASDWIDDITLAKEAHIDAFALNMAKGEPMNAKAIADVFSHAEAQGFQLFFSFDYAGRGPFTKDEVLSWLNKYTSSSAYFRHQGKPLVSTFEGPDQAEDWIEIKAATGCFFIPDWSSLGARVALERAGGVADGLFSWAGWPWGKQDMDTYVDASYRQYLNGKPYMMPVSPWFYTNLPGYSKNWLWRGDHLWFDRWIQVNVLKPEFVQIISWNDYGESHHIGPIRDHALVAFDTGKAPYRYSLDHHGWRVFLPFAIDRYKNNKATITFEGVSFWYRTTPKDACKTGGTTVNTVSQLQIEFQPYDIVEDSVFYTVLLTSAATVTVSIGGVSSKGQWRDLPDGGAGLYHGSAPFNGRTGQVRIVVMRNDVLLADETGPAIKNDCRDGITGYDAWAGGRLTSKASRPIPSPSLEDEVCIRGVGANDFDVLCRTTCFWGYCPEGACVCKATGAQIKLPPETPGEVFPAEGLSSNYIGLCNYACLYGACFSSYCGKTQYPLIEPTVSPFNPPSCISGTGDGAWDVLCSFTCRHGFCPLARCKCTAQGALNLRNPSGSSKAISRIGEDHGLCSFACSRGFCPGNACDSSGGEQQEQNDPVDEVEIPHLDKDCYRFPECVDLDNPQSSSCSEGYQRVGFDRGSCSGSSASHTPNNQPHFSYAFSNIKNQGLPICCKDSAFPMSCTWRGSGGDCNGQCHAKEVTLFESYKGGDPGESGDGKCSRGHKVFCCGLKTFDALTSQCRWTTFREMCESDETEVALGSGFEQGSLGETTAIRYCCKNKPPPLTNCHWVGQGDCADNTCNNKEVTLIVNEYGSNGGACRWWRKKSLCCTPNDAAFGSGVCSKPVCALKDGPDINCDPDEFGEDYSDEDWCDEEDEHDELRRDLEILSLDAYGPLTLEERAVLEDRQGRPKNKKKRREYKTAYRARNRDENLISQARGYPGVTHLFDRTRGPPASSMVILMGGGCDVYPVVRDYSTFTSTQLLDGFDTEHNPDLQFVQQFLTTAITGILPNSSTMSPATIPGDVLDREWHRNMPARTWNTRGTSRCIRNANDLFMDAFGSQGNRAPLLTLERNLNQLKGRIFDIPRQQDPTDADEMDRLRVSVLSGSTTDETELFDHIRRVIVLWNYLNMGDVRDLVAGTRDDMREDIQQIGQNSAPLASLPMILDEVDASWYQAAAERSVAWVEDQLGQIRAGLALLISTNRAPPNAASITANEAKLRRHIKDIKPPKRN